MEIYSVLIVARTRDELRALDTLDLDLKHRAARQESENRFAVPGILTAAQLAELEAAGYLVEVVDDLTGVARERLRELSPENRFTDARSTQELAERTILGYLTVAEIDTALTNLQALNPGLVTLITLPHRTWEGRSCRAVRVRAGSRPNRPGVLFTGGVHAREWGGSDICISLLTNLVNAYRTSSGLTFGGKSYSAAQVRVILENLDLFVFPNVNPDGKHYSQTTDPGTGGGQGLWWRKNRNPNSDTGSTARGVDVNRNFDFLWSSGIGTSSSPSSSTYRGSAPFSEPEARNVRHLFDSYPNIRYYIDIHSFGELILHNWGDDDNQNTNIAQNFRNPAFNGLRGSAGDGVYREFISTLDENTEINLANRMRSALFAVRGRSYTVQQSVGLYPTSATSDDYAFGRHFTDASKNKVYAYTLEFGTEFVPPYAEMQLVIRDVSAALAEFCLAVNSEVYVRDNASDAGNVPSVGAFWNSPDIWVRNADDGGTTHQNTIRGRDNFVYVRVANRGAAEALNLKVRAYVASFAGTQFIHPEDWIPRNPLGGGSIGAPGSYLIGERTIASLAPGASQIARIRWSALLIPPELNWHPCLLVEVAPNDGPRATGRHVWENNNLAQKNVTIVDARRGETVTFPFRIGSPHRVARNAVVVVQRVRAPHSLPVYLDVKDAALINSLRPQLAVAAPVTIPIVALPKWTQATLLQPAAVSLSVLGGGRVESDDELVLAMPAGTRMEVTAETSSWMEEARAGKALSGFSLATLSNQPLLSLGAQAEAKLPLAFRPREVKPMALRVAVPRDAAPGERYTLQVIQLDEQRQVVGGVALEVNVVS